MSTRSEVYNALDTEREYQEMRIRRDGCSQQRPHSAEEFLVYMDDYLREAKHVATHTWGPKCTPAIMEVVRKITALGVACMEANGAPKRYYPVNPTHEMSGTAIMERQHLANQKYNAYLDDLIARSKLKDSINKVADLARADANQRGLDEYKSKSTLGNYGVDIGKEPSVSAFAVGFMKHSTVFWRTFKTRDEADAFKQGIEVMVGPARGHDGGTEKQVPGFTSASSQSPRGGLWEWLFGWK